MPHSENNITFVAKKRQTGEVFRPNKQHYTINIDTSMMNIEEYRAAILQCLLEAKNEDGSPIISEKEAREALNGFTDDELQDGILWNTPEDVAEIILEG